MNKYVRDDILKRHGYTWRNTTPEDNSDGMIAHRKWLICYDPEDGEEIPIIAYRHSGGPSKAHVADSTEAAAERLAKHLLKLEAIAKAQGKRVVSVVEEIIT